MVLLNAHRQAECFTTQGGEMGLRQSRRGTDAPLPCPLCSPSFRRHVHGGQRPRCTMSNVLVPSVG